MAENSNRINAIDLNMAGELLASGGKDLNLRIYDTQTKEVSAPGHNRSTKNPHHPRNACNYLRHVMYSRRRSHQLRVICSSFSCILLSLAVHLTVSFHKNFELSSRGACLADDTRVQGLPPGHGAEGLGRPRAQRVLHQVPPGPAGRDAHRGMGRHDQGEVRLKSRGNAGANEVLTTYSRLTPLGLRITLQSAFLMPGADWKRSKVGGAKNVRSVWSLFHAVSPPALDRLQ